MSEQAHVDWLDEGRESCLIDGVRYTRGRGVKVWLEQDEDLVVTVFGDDGGTLDLDFGDRPIPAILVPIDQHPEGGET